MAASLSAGVNSLILKLDTPYDSLRTYDIRDDLVKIKVWCSTTTGFTPSDTNLVFNALGLSVIITKLTDGTALAAGTTYYVKYAFISAIEESEYTISSELSAVPTQGTPGSSVSMVFKRGAVQPATPDPSASTPAGWYPDVNSVPVGTDPIWTSVGSKSSTATLFTWQTPIRIQGEGGVRGDSARIAYKTQLQSAAAPVISPNTTTGSITFPTYWSGTLTSPAAGESLWASDGIYNTPSNTTTWSTPYLTQGFPVTIQSDNYNAIDTGWQIQRNTGNAFFNNVTARGSLVTGSTGAQRIEINKATSNRLEAFTSNNIRFLTLGGSGGTTQDTAVIGISANANVINPVWIESSANVGSNILTNTLGGANALSSVSTGGGRLFYGYVTGTSNPANAFQIDVNSTGHTGTGVRVNMGTSTGAAFSVGGTGDGYAFDAVNGTSGTGGVNSKSGIGYFRGIDFPTTSSALVSSGSQAQIVINFTNLNTVVGPLLYSFTLENVSYSFELEYDSESFNSLPLFVIAIAASINNTWQVSSTGNFALGSFILKKPTVGVAAGTNSGSIGTFTGTFTNGSAPTYTSTPTIVRLKPFTNVATDVLRGDGSWGSVAGSGGYIDRRYNVRDYGATGNGATDDRAAIQAAINAATATGGMVYFPRGIYVITSSLSYGAIAGGDPNYRVHFAGDGIGASLIKQTGTGDGLVIAGYLGSPINPNLYTHIQDLGFQGSGSGQGLSVTGGAYVYVESCHFTGWAYGFYGANFLSSTFTSCAFRFNQRGFLVERITGGNFASSPNAITMLNCQIGVNSLFGGWVLGAGVFTMQGGTIEGNGTTVGSASNWGLKISEPSGSTAVESAVGVSIDGVYFEVNSGIADLWIESSSTKLGVTNNINGCSFVRVGNTYSTNNILLSSTVGGGFNNFISGCGFKGLGGYTPSASRMTIANSNNKVQLLGCSFDSAVDAYVTGDSNLFENPIRTASLLNLAGTPFITGGVGISITGGAVSLNTAAAANSIIFTNNQTIGGVTIGNTSNIGGFASTDQVSAGFFTKSLNAGIGVAGSGLVGLYLEAPTDAGGVVTSSAIKHTSTTTAAPDIGVSAAISGKGGRFGTLFSTKADVSGTITWNSIVIPAPTSTGTGFLKQDGTWATPVTNTAGTGISITSGVISLNTAAAANSIIFTNNQTIGGVIVGNTSAIGGFKAVSEVSAGFFTNALNALAGGYVGLYLTAPADVNGVVTSASVLHTSPTVLPDIGANSTTGRFKTLFSTSINVSGAITWNAISIPAPTSTGTGFLKQDGTWATPTFSGITSITGTAPVSASTTSGATTISMAAATASANGYMTSTYANKLDGIAAGATANSAGTGISISSGAISINTAAAANSIIFTNNQTINGTIFGAASGVAGLISTDQIAAGFFTKTLNYTGKGNVGIYINVPNDANNLATSSALVHTAPITARPDIGESANNVVAGASYPVGGRFGTVYAVTGNFSGAITAGGDITAFSDERLKTNTQVISDPFKGMDEIYGLTYDRTDNETKGIGFLAQKFQKHYPDIVKENEDGILSLNYMSINAILWEQNRELLNRIKALEAKYDARNN